jgi:two-component system sensor kinase FixL
MGDWDYFPAEDRLQWSDNLRAMYGGRNDEDVFKLADTSRYLNPADAERVASEIQAVLKGETRTYDVEVRMPDGRTSMRRIVAAPVRDASGQIIGAHGTDQDITKDAQLREAEARLQELARLESMNALTATLAHELNQPLAIASNYLSAAARHARQLESAGKVTEMIAEGHKQILHLAQIISAARDLVAHSSSHLVEMPVKDIFDAVVPLLRSLWNGRRAQIDVTVEPGMELVFCNSAQIKQVLFNLGKNGLEAVPEDEEPKLSFRVQRGEADGTRFSVADNGPGISVGDPFAAMSSSKQGGLGLGLALARTIVEAHGGRIWIEKTGPEGTVVAFEIPPQTEEGLVPPRAVH